MVITYDNKTGHITVDFESKGIGGQSQMAFRGFDHNKISFINQDNTAIVIQQAPFVESEFPYLIDKGQSFVEGKYQLLFNTQRFRIGDVITWDLKNGHRLTITEEVGKRGAGYLYKAESFETSAVPERYLMPGMEYFFVKNRNGEYVG